MTKNILIIGPSWVGDMIMAQALFKLLKHQHQHNVIDVLAPAWTFPLLTSMPEVNQGIEMPISHGELHLLKRYRLAKKLKTMKQYDQAIVLTNTFKSALIPWWMNIPVRTGWVGECRYPLLNDWRHLEKKCFPLMIEQYLALGLSKSELKNKNNKSFNTSDYYPSFNVNETMQQNVLEKINPIYRGRPILALAAGAEFGPAKRWPEEYFAEVANEYIARGWDVWLFGSPKDKPITEKIMSLTSHRCEELAGRVVLAESIALLSLVSGVVTNDSGLMHMAAALKKPLIAIYGATSPASTPPLSETKKAKILQLQLSCQPCFKRTCPLSHHRCMRELTPALVMQAMMEWH